MIPLVRGPDAAVLPEKRRTSAFLACETQTASEQAFDKPFEAHWHFVERPMQARADSVNHAAANYGFPNGHALAPAFSI